MQNTPKVNHDFSFSPPQLELFTFSVNNDFDSESYNGRINIKTQTKIQEMKKNENNEEDGKAIVRLIININEIQDNFPFTIKAAISATFAYDNKISNDLKDKLLKINAPALLYSYVRPMVSLMTSNSRFPTFNLPFMDFTKTTTDK